MLSDSTEAYDRGDEFSPYGRIPSLKGYLLVSQAPVQVELFTRGNDGLWTLSDYSALTDRVELPGLDCSLSLAEISGKVALAGT